MIKILAADDHPIVRHGLRRIIEETPDMSVVDEAGSGREVLSKIQKSAYDLLLLDISMPDGNGLDIIGDIKRMKPEMPVIILTIHPERDFAIRMLKAGASGYLTKERAPEELIQAIRRVSQGGRYISASLAEALAFQPEMALGKTIHGALSNREYQIMCMIADGKTVRDIAEELTLSPKTIDTHRRHILEKMGMKNNAEIVRYAIQNGLVK